MSLVKSCWHLLRDLSCSQDQDHVHPHIHAAPTLGVHKNKPPSAKNSAATLGVDQKNNNIYVLGKYSMFQKDNDLSLNMWFKRRDMGYARSLW